MAEYDDRAGTLTAKLVYYGPALSGKTTNLMALHDRLHGRTAGDLMVLDTKNDRTLFFDLLPVRLRAASGLVLRLKLFTVPGQVAHDATRKAVLSRADGVAFVADSQTGQSLNNFESFRNLEENAARVGLDLERLPLVIQFNKRDLADVTPEAELRTRWGSSGVPLVFASALYDRGVAATFAALLRSLHAALEREHGLASRWQVQTEDLIQGVLPAGVADREH